MKKTVLVFAIFIACVFMTFAQAWEKRVVEDKWGDKELLCAYSQWSTGTDVIYTYDCYFILAVDGNNWNSYFKEA